MKLREEPALSENILLKLKEKLRGKIVISEPLGTMENQEALENYKNDIKTDKKTKKKGHKEAEKSRESR